MKTQRVAPINGDEQVAARGLIWHLRQVLDVDVKEARLVVLEGLFWRDRFAFGFRDHILEARHAFALQETGDPRPGDFRIDVSLKVVCSVCPPVGAIMHVIAFDPLFRCRPGNVEDLGCFPESLISCRIFGVVRACG
jgi:hypothetical protein